MLILTRQEGEAVVIGDPLNPICVLHIQSIRSDRVRIAFEAPPSVAVHRHEIAERIRDNQAATARRTTPDGHNRTAEERRRA